MANKMRADLPDTPLVTARRALVTARDDFDREQELAWAQRSADLRANLDRLVWELRYKEGRSVTYICEQYGTKDRNTIYGILERAERVHGVPPLPTRTRPVAPAVTAPEPTSERYTLTDLDETTWLVTDSANGRTVEVSKSTGKTGVNVGTPALGVEMRKDPNHEAWAAVPTTNGE